MSETEFVKLTVKQVADEIGENVHTVRNWIRDFKAYIPLEKSAGGFNLFNQDSMKVVLSIKKKYREQGLSTKQIQAILSGAALPVEEKKSDIEIITERLERQEKILSEMWQMQRAQNDYIENSIRARDEKLLLALNEFNRAKKERGFVQKLVTIIFRKKFRS